jgi:hypothetical protein
MYGVSEETYEFDEGIEVTSINKDYIFLQIGEYEYKMFDRKSKNYRDCSEKIVDATDTHALSSSNTVYRFRADGMFTEMSFSPYNTVHISDNLIVNQEPNYTYYYNVKNGKSQELYSRSLLLDKKDGTILFPVLGKILWSGADMEYIDVSLRIPIASRGRTLYFFNNEENILYSGPDPLEIGSVGSMNNILFSVMEQEGLVVYNKSTRVVSIHVKGRETTYLYVSERLCVEGLRELQGEEIALYGKNFVRFVKKGGRVVPILL